MEQNDSDVDDSEHDFCINQILPWQQLLLVYEQMEQRTKSNSRKAKLNSLQNNMCTVYVQACKQKYT